MIEYRDAPQDENEPKEVNISLSIDATTHRFIKTLAAMCGKNMRDIIRKHIEDADWKGSIAKMMT